MKISILICPIAISTSRFSIVLRNKSPHLPWNHHHNSGLAVTRRSRMELKLLQSLIPKEFTLFDLSGIFPGRPCSQSCVILFDLKVTRSRKTFLSRYLSKIVTSNWLNSWLPKAVGNRTKNRLTILRICISRKWVYCQFHGWVLKESTNIHTESLVKKLKTCNIKKYLNK